MLSVGGVVLQLVLIVLLFPIWRTPFSLPNRQSVEQVRRWHASLDFDSTMERRQSTWPVDRNWTGTRIHCLPVYVMLFCCCWLTYVAPLATISLNDTRFAFLPKKGHNELSLSLALSVCLCLSPADSLCLCLSVYVSLSLSLSLLQAWSRASISAVFKLYFYHTTRLKSNAAISKIQIKSNHSSFASNY